MRAICLVLGLVLLPTLAVAEDLLPTLTREVRRCAAAWQRGDYERILAYLPPQVLQRSGGPAAWRREIKEQFAQVRASGVESFEAVPGRPANPKPIGHWLVSLIPLTAVLHHAHLDLTQSTQVLGLSVDQGKHWYFVPLYQVSQAELNAWLPELAGRVVVPLDPAPRLELVY